MKHPTGLASATSKPAPRAREISVDRSLVLATLAVLLAGYAFKVSNTGSLALLVLGGTIVANLVVIVRCWLVVNAHPASQQCVVVSLALEGFLLSIAALVASDQQAGWLSVLTSLLMILALAVFLWASQQAPEEKRMEIDPRESLPDARVSERVRRPAGQHALPVVVGSRPSAVQPYRPLEIESSQPAPPGLLFKDDPLHVFPAPPRLARFFVVAKNNDNLVKCEDACAFSENRLLLYALADGTSSSNFPRPWASLLTRSWVEDPDGLVQSLHGQQLEYWLDVRRKRWQHWIYQTWLPSINERNAAQRQPPATREVADEIIEGGASATLLGLRLSLKHRAWDCVAVGDTCLFHVSASFQESGGYQAFPLERSADFNTSPPSLSTLAGLRPQVQWLKGEVSPGDIFFLATDALATWICQRLEQGDRAVWQQLLQIRSNKEFSTFVNQMRSAVRSHHMNDDDTSLFIIDTATMMRN
jgi:Ca2+/Na+ antiporter